MNQNMQLMTLYQGCEEAVTQAVRLLVNDGLQVVRSFDLQSARTIYADCACPHHGTTQCTCQMVVLLVYSQDSASVTLVAHGHDDQTWFSLADTPRQPENLRLRARIEQVLTPYHFLRYSGVHI